MSEPTVLIRPSAVALAASLLALAACQREEAVAPAPAPAPPPPVVVIGPSPVLDRNGLLQAVDQAASDYAAGRAAADKTFAGRRFLIRQAFGCGLPVDSSDPGIEEGTAGLVKGGRTSDLELTLTPADWTPALPSDNGSAAWEAAEGFWLPWPWLRADGCPRPVTQPIGVDRAPTETAPAAQQSVGLAAVFDTDGSRLGRRKGRAYQFILRGEGQQAPVPDAGGYRLVLEGRMAAFTDGHAIRCRATQPEQRPVCVAAVRLERVAFEDSGGQTLVEWRS